MVNMVLVGIIEETPETSSPIVGGSGGHRECLSHGGREISTETTKGGAIVQKMAFVIN